MSWESEVKSEIKFTAPSAQDTGLIGSAIDAIKKSATGTGSGGVFTAKWRGNERTMERKIGMFDPPNINGTFVQDMGAKSWVYPLTVYFDGLKHNKEAERFAKALENESGIWEVDHPTKGKLPLMLLSVKENIAPVEAGNYTEFTTNWIRPAQAKPIDSSQSLLAKLEGAINDIQDAIIAAQQLRTDAYAAVQSAINGFNNAVGSIDSALAIVSQTDAIIRDAYESAKRAFNNAIDNFSIDDNDPTDIYNASIDIMTAPIDASTEFSEGFNNYKKTYTSIKNNFTGKADLDTDTALEENTNKYKTQEFFLVVIFLKTCQAVYNVEFQTRVQVVSAIDNIKDLFDDLIAELDRMQDVFSALPIEDQLYTQSATYIDLYTIYADTLRYLFLQFYNLKSEKIITLKKTRSPLEITVTEYGTLGNNGTTDVFYDLFLTSNNLDGDDILLLPAGREVKIYV